MWMVPLGMRYVVPLLYILRATEGIGDHKWLRSFLTLQ